jgi:hypothetical protein
MIIGYVFLIRFGLGLVSCAAEMSGGLFAPMLSWELVGRLPARRSTFMTPNRSRHRIHSFH